MFWRNVLQCFGENPSVSISSVYSSIRREKSMWNISSNRLDFFVVAPYNAQLPFWQLTSQSQTLLVYQQIHKRNLCIRFGTWEDRRMNRNRSFGILSDKPSRIERYSRPEYKSADPNWFIRQTFHVLNSNIRFGTWKVRRMNRALVFVITLLEKIIWSCSSRTVLNFSTEGD